jgi:hypothetical protein
MSEFSYLSEKIKGSKFSVSPFKHIYIENFLSEEHLELVLNDKQIHFENKADTISVINELVVNGYDIQQFPGCSTNVQEYLTALKEDKWPNERGGTPIESYGITFRLKKYKSSFIQNLIEYLNGSEFKSTLENKFDIQSDNRIITAVQKNLSKYEISPHPDVREKALTYLININKDDSIDKEPIHTHLLKFKPQYEFIYNYWQTNLSENRCWVPWSWCNTVKVTNKNNSLVMFAPNVDTLHAVKLDYDHTKFQRTQLYGNLMYNKKVVPQMRWKKLLEIKEQLNK